MARSKRWPTERFVPIAVASHKRKRVYLWHHCIPCENTRHGYSAGGEWYVATYPSETFDQAFLVRAADLRAIRRHAA